MALRINDEAPNFTADTTQGKIDFHDWIGNGWAILFSTRRISRRSARPNSATWPG
jgi:alkyl hydroperoxide reductase subunit AhpC